MLTIPELNTRLIFVFIPLSLLVILYGCVVGWTANAMSQLQPPHSEIDLTKTETTYLAAFLELGRLSSAVPAGLMGDIVGRRPIIYACALQHLAAWTLKVLTRSKYVLFFARFLGGTAIGVGNSIIFIYGSEVAPAKIRGTLISILYSCYYFGILVQYTFGVFFNYSHICMYSFGISILPFFFGWWIEESPNFLLMKRKNDEAERIHSLLNANRPADEVAAEFDALRRYVNRQLGADADGKSNRGDGRTGFADPINRKLVALTVCVTSFTQCTGQPPVLAFINKVFQHVDVLTPAQFSVIFAALQFLAGMCSSFLSDQIGRRKTYIIACSLCVVTHACSVALHTIESQLGDSHSTYTVSWLLLASVSSYACVYAATLGPLTTLIRGELLPMAVKGIGSGLNTMFAGITTLTLVFVFFFISENVGMAYNFVFFFVMTLLLASIVYFMLPETKQRTLAEIQHSYRTQ